MRQKLHVHPRDIATKTKEKISTSSIFVCAFHVVVLLHYRCHADLSLGCLTALAQSCGPGPAGGRWSCPGPGAEAGGIGPLMSLLIMLSLMCASRICMSLSLSLSRLAYSSRCIATCCCCAWSSRIRSVKLRPRDSKGVKR